MQIDQKQLAGKPKKVGKANGKDVFALATKGGLHMIFGQKDTGFETLGAGPHPAVARHIASQKADITWTDLNKSDHVEVECYEHILPKYQEITDALRRRNGDE